MRYLLVVVFAGLALGVGYAAGQTTTAAPQPSNDTGAILAKLDQVLAKQEQLVQRFDAVDEQLRIITVRASQKH